MGSEPTTPQLLFRRRQRLGHRREFDAVFSAHVRKHRGPLTVFAIPNKLPNHRLGLSVPRRVGNAVVRNRVKRRLREAFRLLQYEMEMHDKGGFDFVIAVRPHEPMGEAEYRELLREAAARLAGEWKRRHRRTDERP